MAAAEPPRHGERLRLDGEFVTVETAAATDSASRLTFLRRMKEERKDLNGDDLFPPRYAETTPVTLGELELTCRRPPAEGCSTRRSEVRDRSRGLGVDARRCNSGDTLARSSGTDVLTPDQESTETAGQPSVPAHRSTGPKTLLLTRRGGHSPVGS